MIYFNKYDFFLIYKKSMLIIMSILSLVLILKFFLFSENLISIDFHITF